MTLRVISQRSVTSGAQARGCVEGRHAILGVVVLVVPPLGDIVVLSIRDMWFHRQTLSIRSDGRLYLPHRPVALDPAALYKVVCLAMAAQLDNRHVCIGVVRAVGM